MVDAKYVTFHPRHCEALALLEARTTVDALPELLHGANRITNRYSALF